MRYLGGKHQGAPSAPSVTAGELRRNFLTPFVSKNGVRDRMLSAEMEDMQWLFQAQRYK